MFPSARALLLLLLLALFLGFLRLLRLLMSLWPVLFDFPYSLALAINPSHNPDDIVGSLNGNFMAHAIQHLDTDVVFAEDSARVLCDLVGNDDGVGFAEDEPYFF